MRSNQPMNRTPMQASTARSRAIENWLHGEVGPAYEALKADPSGAITADWVRARLAAEQAKAGQSHWL